MTFMGWGGQQEDEGVRAAIEVFEQENPGIHVEWLQVPTQTTPDFTSAFLSNVAAGTPPDTAFVDSSNYETFSKRGLLMDITDRIARDAAAARAAPQARSRARGAPGAADGPCTRRPAGGADASRATAARARRDAAASARRDRARSVGWHRIGPASPHWERRGDAVS